MIIDCNSDDFLEHWPDKRRRVFVNDVEIRQVYYLDTDAGIVRTYDVLGDGEAHMVSQGFGKICYRAADFPGRNVFAPLDGILNETLLGKVTLLAWNE